MAENQVEFQAEVVVEHQRQDQNGDVSRRRCSYEAREAAMTTIGQDGSVIRRRHVVTKKQVSAKGREPRKDETPNATN